MPRPLSCRPAARAFTLPELVACAAALALALLLAHVASTRSRALARCGEDLSHLRTIYASHQSYAADFNDQVAHFSWRPFQTNTTYPDLQNPTENFQAHRYQMVDIIRRRGGRPAMPNMAATALYPNVYYSHLVLLDYLGAAPPTRLFVSAGDRRAQWADDPLGYDQGLYLPDLGHSVTPNDLWRHPYGASYFMSIGFFDDSPPGVHAFPQQVTSNLFYFSGQNGTLFRGTRWMQVAMPAHKAFVFDHVARYFGTSLWHMDDAAKVPVLMADGAASVRAASEANRGANPNLESGPAPLLIYDPNVTQPPASTPPQQYHAGIFWTRMNLGGRDFGGPDVFP